MEQRSALEERSEDLRVINTVAEDLLFEERPEDSRTLPIAYLEGKIVRTSNRVSLSKRK